MHADPRNARADAVVGGTIHDIGYRSYDGPRLGDRQLAAALFAHGLRSSFGIGRAGRAKVAPFVLLAALSVPALIIVVVTTFVRLPTLPVTYVGYLLDTQVLLTIWLAVLAPTIIARDLRFRATSLYFARPLGRGRYLLARYASTVAGMLVMTLGPMTVLFVGALLAELDATQELGRYARGVAVALLLSALLAAIGLLAASFAPRRGMATAAIVAVLLVLSGVRLILHELGGEIGHDALELYSSLVSPYALVDGLAAGLLDASAHVGDTPRGPSQVAVFAVAWLALIAGTGLLLAQRFRKVSIL